MRGNPKLKNTFIRFRLKKFTVAAFTSPFIVQHRVQALM